MKPYVNRNRDVLQLIENIKYTPSRSQVITFSNNELSPPKITLKSSDDKIKPLEDSTINKNKKKKQGHLTDNFGNSNLILIGYNPIAQE
ncbi:hypothetical protein RclHR1_32200001 [Rhizophagus clarus]|uniref:Uncharacterized protein n=1 Tax=Rhizophagus clarus TaxID=94130 RepID=A0A2Z6R8J4_9GLOM|nr:hypothetical protein RclHR1_32200001 [Rhizophagus clarus]GES89605.1 hypothetical protein RCL_jg1432.t1 [Rhizophagus clarus]